jgi:hypothetical protein
MGKSFKENDMNEKKDFLNLENKDDILLIADFGRSAQGWLSFMLSFILNARYIEPYALILGTPHSKSKMLMDNTMGDLKSRNKTQFKLVVKTHGFPDRNNFELTKSIIYLTRDPRDVAISYYYLNRKWVKDGGRSPSLFLYLVPFFCYLMVAYKWQRHARRWKSTKHMHVKYEDLRHDTEGTLVEILKNFDVNVDINVVRESISLFSYENSYKRKRGVEDKNNPSARKGQIGDYRNYFGFFMNKIFWMICGQEAERFGYRYDGSTTIEPINNN